MISNMSNISNIRPNIICKETGFPMSNIGELLKISGLDNNSKMLLIIGEDRANAFNWLKNYFPNLVIDALDRPEGAMSATKIRGFVSAENENAFNQAYAGILQPNRIKELYEEISLGLANYAKTTSTSTKKSTKNPKNEEVEKLNQKAKNLKAKNYSSLEDSIDDSIDDSMDFLCLYVKNIHLRFRQNYSLYPTCQYF